MGKGDKKTRKGKITQGSYGNTRPKKASKPLVVIAEKPVKPKVEKAEAAPKPKATKAKAETAAEEKPKPVKKKKTEE